VLQEMGFNLFALSNNHAADIGTVGVLNTLREAKARNLAHAGTGTNVAEAAAPAYLNTPHGKVALVAMASGLIRAGGGATNTHPGVNEIRMEGGIPDVDAGHPNPEDAQRILQSIREAAKHADLVIAYQHNHVYDKDFVSVMREELPERLVPPKWIKAWAHEEVDAGADIVVMHGAPLLQGVEIYRGRLIFYDLGNFVFQLPLYVDIFEPIVYDSVVAHVVFQGKALKSVTLDPITLNIVGRGEGELARYTHGLPASVTGKRAGYILQRIIDASRPFGTTIAMKGDTAELVLGPATSGP
jgi:poly-gamma-glutamate synthesis protein (capsule biosynthesis protein)